jgi:hypothetical protein
MSGLLAERYDVRTHRLALGIEPLDAARGGRVAQPLAVTVEGVAGALQPPGRFDDALPRVDRHDSCLYALVYRRGLHRPPPDPTEPALVTLRFRSPDRRHVPRRLRFRLVDPATLAEADAGDPPAGDPALLGRRRIRRVGLFPGAAYDVGPTTTGLRGRGRASDGSPVRWVRVEAWTQDAFGARVDLVGRAHGDDRGEFLLLVQSRASGVGPLDLAAGIALVVDVHAPPVPNVPLALRVADPLWDLPVEQVTGAGPSDPVSLGERIPAGSTLASRVETFTLGRCLTSEIAPFTF